MGIGVSQCPVHSSLSLQSACRPACDEERSGSQFNPFDIFFRIGFPMILSAALGLDLFISRNFIIIINNILADRILTVTLMAQSFVCLSACCL